MTDVVVLRAKPHGKDQEHQFLSGTASIGWPGLGDLGGADRARIEEALRAHDSSDAVAIRVSQIHRFVHLPVGSLMLTPSYQNRDIHVFKTTSGYQYEHERLSEGNPHTIKIEHINTLPRSAFPDQVQRALLAAKKTITNFSKYESLILPVISGDDTSQDRSQAGITASDAEADAVRTLHGLLDSDDENVRLQAAVALLGKTAA